MALSARTETLPDSGLSNAPALNNLGHVAYGNNQGIRLDGVLVVGAGGTATDAGIGITFGAVDQFVLNDNDQIAYRAVLAGTGVNSTNSSSIWRGTTLIAREGALVAGFTDVSYGDFFTPAINNNGGVAYTATLTGAATTLTDNQAFFLDGGIVLRSHDAATATGGMIFGTIPLTDVARLNDSGQVAYQANFIEQGGSTLENGLFVNTTLRVRAGAAATTAGAGVTFGSLNQPTINNAGQIAFTAVLSGAVTVNDNGGLFVDDQLIARRGGAAYGTGPDIVFKGFSVSPPTLNESGQVVYKADLVTNRGGVTAITDTGIWRDTTLIVREGQAAPTGEDGALFLNLVNDPVLNDHGLVAFESLLIGTGVTRNLDDHGLYLGDGQEIVQVARKSCASCSIVFDDEGTSNGFNNFG